MRVFIIRKPDGTFIANAVGSFHEVMCLAGYNTLHHGGDFPRNRSRVNHWYNL